MVLAVEGAHVVTTRTADERAATVPNDDAVGAGAHLDAVGGDCAGRTELAEAILHRASIFVEHTALTRVEGDLRPLAPDPSWHGTLAPRHGKGARMTLGG